MDTLAWPCLPGLDVDISTILQGRPLITTCPFLRRVEHCTGLLLDGREQTVSNVSSEFIVDSLLQQNVLNSHAQKNNVCLNSS